MAGATPPSESDGQKRLRCKEASRRSRAVEEFRADSFCLIFNNDIASRHEKTNTNRFLTG